MQFILESQTNPNHCMLGEWLKKFREKRITPKNDTVYTIHPDIVNYTVSILKEYGSVDAEGVVYWAGKVEGNKKFVCAAVAPKIRGSRFGFYTDHQANADFVEFIRSHNLVYICQVHSHPGDYVDHSITDDKETAFRAEGLISIVVPHFGKFGLLPFSKCGIHLFTKGAFFRLSDRYIHRNFKTINFTSSPILKDLRNADKL